MRDATGDAVWWLGHPNELVAVGPQRNAVTRQGYNLPLSLPPSTLGVHKHQQGMCPRPGADLEGRKGDG